MAEWQAEGAHCGCSCNREYSDISLIEVRDARSTSEMETLPACVMLCDVSGRVPLDTLRRASVWKGEQVKAVGPTDVHLDWI